jgi:hypothetical protein
MKRKIEQEPLIKNIHSTRDIDYSMHIGRYLVLILAALIMRGIWGFPILSLKN